MTEFTKTLATLVKRANQRLTQLEKSGKQSHQTYQDIKRYAVNNKKAYRSVKDEYLNTTKYRFRGDLSKMTIQEKQSLRAELIKFLNKETSTVTGIKNVEKLKKETYDDTLKQLQSDYNNLSKSDIHRIFSDPRMKQIMKKENYSSDSVLDMFNDSKDSSSIHKMLSVLNNMTDEEREQWIDGRKQVDFDDSDFKSNKRYK